MKTKLLLLFWVFVLIGGFHTLMSFSGEAGESAMLGRWPATSHIQKPTSHLLLMFVHPGCSCSKASLAELSRLLGSETELRSQVVFMKSKKLEQLFHENDLVKIASRLPRTKIVYDADGIETKNFNAKTSGQSFLFDQHQNLLFSGGLTMARGHEGQSASVDAIKKHLKGKTASSRLAVFGCSLFEKIKTIAKVSK